MRYRIVEKPSFRVVGRKARVPLVHRGPNQAIIDFVKGLEPAVREQIAALSDEEPVGTVAVTDAIDESRRRELDYWHGAVTSGEVPPGLKSLDVPAGTWRAYSPSEACRVHIDRSQFEHRHRARQPPCRHEPIDSAGRIRYEGDSASLT